MSIQEMNLPAAKKLAPKHCWQDKTWGEVLDHHIARTAFGPAVSIGFDEEDKLCVVCIGQGGFCQRIPASLQAAVEHELAVKGITPYVASPRQVRQSRGPEGKGIHDRPMDPELFYRLLSELSGLTVDRIRADLRPMDAVVNFVLPHDRPFLYERHGDTSVFGYAAIVGKEVLVYVLKITHAPNGGFITLQAPARLAFQRNGYGGAYRYLQEAFQFTLSRARETAQQEITA